MMTRYYNDRFSPESYQASKIPATFTRYADYLLINWQPNYVDAKRIWPLIWLYIGVLSAIFLAYLFYEIEQYTYYFFSNISSVETRIESIVRRIEYRYEKGRTGHFIGLFISPILLYYVLKLTFGRYPTPLRFNKANGLVYTIRGRRVWVTHWQRAHIKLWRHTNNMSGGRVLERAIAVRLFSINCRGQLITRWEPVSALDNQKLTIDNWEITDPSKALGGDPSLLYWAWLNAYMQGEELAKPAVGKQTVLEKLRILPYYFPKKTDAKAEKLAARLIAEQLYPTAAEDKKAVRKIPKDPYFTHEEDYPDVPRPDYQIPNYLQQVKQQLIQQKREEEQKNRPMPAWQKRGFEQWRGNTAVSDAESGNEQKGDSKL
jgi:hypothetical protein